MNDSEHEQLNKILKFYEFVLHNRDRYEDGHARRVGILSIQLARWLGYSRDDIESVRFGARFHDVGKLALSAELLNKKTLTDQDFYEIQQHVQKGFELFMSIGINGKIGRIIAESHENFDGSGYPKKKGGQEIYEGARIVRIADTYDTLISRRSYKESISPNDAMDEMRRCAVWYDPLIFEIFAEKMTVKD